MANVLVRDLEPSVINRLKLRAEKQKRSLQSEMNLILTEAANVPEPMSELELLRKFRASLKNVNKSSAVEMLREDRSR